MNYKSITTLDEDSGQSLWDLAGKHDLIRRAFLLLARPLAETNHNFQGYSQLTITAPGQKGDRIVMEHLGTEIRFDLRLGMNENDEAVGTVYCSLVHEIFGAQQFVPLGMFEILRDGNASPEPASTGGKLRPKDFDLIVTHVLREAHRENRKLKSISGS